MYEEGKSSDNEEKVVLSIKRTVFENNIVRYLIYASGFIIMYLIVHSFYYLDVYPDDWGKAFGTFHMVTCRSFFTIGLSLVMYPVLIGRGKVLLAILGHFIFNPLGKLTYGTYMIHLPLFFLVTTSYMQAKYYSCGEALIMAICMFGLSYLVSFIITIIYESPVVQLLKVFLEGGARSAPAKVDGNPKEENIKKITP